jgi:hypothetical protein
VPFDIVESDQSLSARFDFLLQYYTNKGEYSVQIFHSSFQISSITRQILFVQKIPKLGFMFGVSGVESTGIHHTVMKYYKQMYKLLH